MLRAVPSTLTLTAIPRDFKDEVFMGQVAFLSPNQQHVSTELILIASCACCF